VRDAEPGGRLLLRVTVGHEPQHVLLPRRDRRQGVTHVAGELCRADRRIDPIEVVVVELFASRQLRQQRLLTGITAFLVTDHVDRDPHQERCGLTPGGVVPPGRVEETDEGDSHHVRDVLGARASFGCERRHPPHMAAVELLVGCGELR